MKLTEKTIKSKKIYEGKILDFYLDEIITPYGNKATREYSKHIFAVGAVVKYKGKYVLEKQYRYPVHKITLEIPAGKGEINEKPTKSIKREVYEECGLNTKKIKSLGYYYPAAAYSDEKLYLYYIEADKQEEQKLDKDEAINLVYLTKQEVLKALKDNTIDDSKTIIAFYRLFNL